MVPLMDGAMLIPWEGVGGSLALGEEAIIPEGRVPQCRVMDPLGLDDSVPVAPGFETDEFFLKRTASSHSEMGKVECGAFSCLI